MAAARRRSRRSPRACSSPVAGSRPGAAARRTSRKIRAATWCERRRSTRSPSASAVTRCGRPPPSSSSVSRSRCFATRAISRAGSASGSASLLCPSPSLISSCSTSRLGGSTPIGRRRSPPGCSARPSEAAAFSSQRTIRCSRRTDGCGSAHPWRCRLRSRAALVAFAALGIGGVLWAAVDPADGGLATLLAAFALVAGGFAWLEQGGGTARDLTLVATLGGIAAAGRVLFAPVPGVQPVTVIVAAAGVALGPRRGFAVGALAAIASNMFLGQGPHTPWQMLAWGACGLLAGVFGFALRGRWPFALFCAVLGMAFGTLMDLWLWFAFYPHTWAALVTVLGAGVAFNIAHALGNLVLALVAGPELRRVLDRHGRSVHTEVVWA